MPALPATIGRYRVVNRIGRGGMGTLYLAFDPSLERQVAIKILIDDNDELRERFSREARSAARLHHPNIVTMYDVGEDDGRPFMAMEYIQGETLAEIIRKREPLTTLRKLQLAESLVDGLGFAHKAGIVHRDVKPANIMVDVAGALKILDFGIARIAESSSMTRAGAPVGTLNYMSPEQLGGQAVDRRSDIFSVGAVCYELLSYRQAFPGGLDAGVLQKLLSGRTEPLATVCDGLDPEIVQIVDRCLEADLQKRYQDLDSMLKDLTRVRRRLSPQESGAIAVMARPPSPAQETPAVLASGKVSRRAMDLEEFARRRAGQIQTHLKTAHQAFEAGDYDTAIAECERVLMIDAEQPDAIELVDRGRTAIDERQAEQWLGEAEGDIQRGALTAAVSKIEQAAALVPSSPRAAEVRRAADQALRERELARQRAEKIQALISDGHASFDKARFADAVAAADQALTLEPDQAEAKALRSRALDAIEAQAREELARRARECVREARRRFDGNDHGAALDLLARFEPKHEIVSQALEELRVESVRIAAQRRVEAEQRAKQQRIEAELVNARADIERQQFAEALQRLHALMAAEGESPEIATVIRIAETAQIEFERAESRARTVAEAIAQASGLFARRDFAAALTRIDAALALEPNHGPAQALRSRIQEPFRLAAERRDARDRRALERDQSVTVALDDAQRATSDEEALEALYKALELAPEHPRVRRLLAEREDRVARQEAERRRVLESERTRREQIEQLLDSVREALRADDVTAARRALRRVHQLDPENLESQCLASHIAATYGEPTGDDVFDSSIGQDPVTTSVSPTQVRAETPVLKPSPNVATPSQSLFGLPLNTNVVLGVAAVILVLLLIGYFLLRG